MELPKIEQRHKDLLEKLCNAAGVSGHEDEVRKIVLAELKGKHLNVRTDALGSVIATPKQRDASKPLVMLDAHMDEVGFMLVSDDGDGLYSFELVGGIDPRSLPGKQVLVGNDKVPGVIGAKPIHLTTADERAGKLSVESLKIDVGTKGKNIQPGDRAVFATKLMYVEDNIFAKAIDDRIGVAILLQMMEQEFPNIQLAFSFSVQEEIGLRGAKVAAQSIDPDFAIAIDATPAYDHPAPDGSIENSYYNTKIGLGPAIYTYDGSTLNDPRLVTLFKRVGEEEKITYQLRQPGGGGTNGGSIHRANGGVPTISISVPHRYTHTAILLSKLTDWESSVRLLAAGLSKMSYELTKQPRP